MALSVVNADALRSSTAIDWAAVQFAQFEHDEKYHREISRLPMQDRLRHMALHFAKYSGRLQNEPDDQLFMRLATDALIIAMSCANILNIDLTEKALCGGKLGGSRSAFAKRIAVAGGKMASACERLDHIEDFPFRVVLTDETLAILSACIDLFKAENWCAVGEMEKRLAPIKAKSIFHGKL